MQAIKLNDPPSDLGAAACNLMGECVGARHCGAIALETGELKAASSEFLQLGHAARTQIVDSVVAAVAAAPYAPGEARSDRLVEVPVDAEVGERAAAVLLPENDTIVFVVPPPGETIALAALRRAAIAALPLFHRIDALTTERQRLVADNQLLSHVEELSKIGGWEQSADTGNMRWSSELYAIHGIEPRADLTLEHILDLYPSPAREKLTRELERTASEGGGFELTTPIRTPSGEQRIVRTVGRSGGKVGESHTLYGIAQDITAQLSSEKRRWWAANHDPITSLPNRLLFEDRLAVATRRARREGRRFALLLISITDDARLERPSGFTVPDKHMMEIAGRLSAVTRESDTIARTSTEEFALILSDVDTSESFAPAVARLEEQFAQMRREGNADGIVVSGGAAFFPEHADSPEDLTRGAEMALSRAKQDSGQAVVLFDRKIADDLARRRSTILMRARESLERGEFLPFYQPQVDIETNQIVGVEALVRWQTADITLDAKDFTYALDDHEIGGMVGRVVLDAVIADLTELRRINRHPFRVSINASRTEVLRNDFLDTFLTKTRDGNLKPTDFIIEITEDVIIGVDDRALHDKLSYLVSSGVELSLDDFGTGFASLIHITTFPVKELKIDKQFVFGLETDRRKKAIVRGIVQIAQSMGLNVIAEGVETTAQREALRELGCRYVQGYLYSYPVPFKEFAAMLDTPD